MLDGPASAPWAAKSPDALLVVEPGAEEPATDAKAVARRERAAAKQAGRQQRADAKDAARHERAEAKATARRERAAAKQAGRQQRADAKDAEDAKRQQRADAKATARRERAAAKAAARTHRSAQRSVEREDHIVEPPREPKLPLAARLRRSGAGDAATPPVSKRVAAVVAGIVGAVGLVCSLVLAVGALMVALGAGEGNAAYDLTTSVCDSLVGPLRDVFTFTGGNADMKQSLVAWGLGSMGYLVIGLFAQSVLRSRLDD